jgi:hypothetical protein
MHAALTFLLILSLTPIGCVVIYAVMRPLLEAAALIAFITAVLALVGAFA